MDPGARPGFVDRGKQGLTGIPKQFSIEAGIEKGVLSPPSHSEDCAGRRAALPGWRRVTPEQSNEVARKSQPLVG